MKIKDNIFYRSINSIKDYNTFNWHKDSDKINSSQALAIDFWGCLKLSPYKDQLINLIFSKNGTGWDIEFEYVNKAILSETKASTQIDILIKNNNYVIVIESKFTEKDGGGCSQINKTKEGLYQCNGNYEDQINPKNKIKSKCALTGKGINYWNFIDELTSFSKNNTYSPCPFKNGEYQWMRNICFAEAFAKRENLKAESYLVFLKSNKCSISQKVDNNTFLGKLEGNIKSKLSFIPMSYNELVTKCILFLEFDSNEKRIWIDLEKWILNKEYLIN
jgi:hypothetical protein